MANGLREQIMEALVTLLTDAGSFKTVSRRLVDPEGLNENASPALFVIEHEDRFDRTQGNNMPPKRSMMVLALVYDDVGSQQNAIPSTTVNNNLDALEAALGTPDNQMLGTLTLGGLAMAVTIDGETQRASGDVTGKAAATIPIRIFIP